jgi:hypothetical protein
MVGNVKSFNFAEQLAVSDSPAVAALVDPFLRRRFPGALSLRRAAEANDRAGADIIVEFPHCQFRFIDLKVRTCDYRVLGKADIALEIWSNKERETPGWALDESKVSDWLLFVWMDTKRTLLLDARAVRAVTKSNLPRWQASYQNAEQRTPVGARGYNSSVIFVGTDELVALVNRWQGHQNAA